MKFISIVMDYSPVLQQITEEEDYHWSALQSAKEAGFQEVELFIQDPKCVLTRKLPAGVQVQIYTTFFSYLSYLWGNRKRALFYINSLSPLSLLAGALVKKSIFIPHAHPMPPERWKRAVLLLCYRFFTIIRLPTKEHQELLTKELFIPKSRIIVLPLAIDTSHIPHIAEKKKFTKLVMLSNFRSMKDPYTVIRAYAKAKKQEPEMELSCIGKDELHREGLPSISEFSRQLKLKTPPRELGPVPHQEIIPTLEEFDIYVNSSTSEGQCLTAYEAALAGLALCLPKTPSFIGVFRDTALFHNPYDSEQLARNILFYTKHPEIAWEHVQKNQKMVREKYNPQVLSSCFVALLHQLARP